MIIVYHIHPPADNSAADVAHAAGFDIEGGGFWRQGLGVIAGRIGDFEKLVNE
jgi:oligoendopeptidase F